MKEIEIMSSILAKVKRDYEKRGDKTYDLLYTLYALVPEKFKDSIIYHESIDSLFVGVFHLQHLKEISNIYEVPKGESDDDIHTIIKFEKMALQTGEVYATRTIVFKYNDNNVLVYKYSEDDWVEE